MRPSLARIGAGLLVVSFGVLSVEICLTRVFSYAISYHFAYLTIATALLGFGAGGSVLASFPAIGGSATRRLTYGSILAGLGVVATLAFSSVARFDPTFIGSDPGALAMLGLYYLVITVPFFFAGLVIATGLSTYPEHVGRLYALDLLGAALGCATAVPLMWLCATPTAVAVGAVALGIGGLIFAGADRRLQGRALAGVVLIAALGTLTARVGPFPPSPGRFLSHYLRTPGVQHLFHQWTPLNRVDAVGWERSPNSWRGSYASAGVSSRFTGRGPEYRMIGYDGGSFAVMYEYDPSTSDLDVFRRHVMAAPYQLLEHPRTLIIGLGGGADALAGIANDVGPMTGIELNPVTVRLGRDDFRDFNGDLFRSPRLDVVNAEARHYVEASTERFDLIVLNSIDTLSALSSGAYVLAESYLYTREAFARYLAKLSPDGMFALYAFDNFGLAGPSVIIMRFAETLRAALASLDIPQAASHVAVVAGPGETPLVATLVRPAGFDDADVQRLEAFVEREGFSFWHRPDRAVDHPVGRFLWAKRSAQRTLVDDHYLNLAAATDDSPFFFNFYKWASLLRHDPRDTDTTPSTGQRMLLVMVIQAAVIVVILTLGPLWWMRNDASHRPGVPWRFVAYFASLGFGFILLEISLMQRFVLFLGFPTYSLSVVLCTLLLATGAGSALSTRSHASETGVILRVAVVLAAVLALLHLILPPLFDGMLDKPLAVRIAVSVATLFPLGVLLGAFFPLGIHVVRAVDPRLVPWAWAVNGCTTVVGTVLAVMLAMSYGFTTVMVLAVSIYLTGALVLWGGRAADAR